MFGLGKSLKGGKSKKDDDKEEEGEEVEMQETKKEEELKIGEMRRGDYMVHVFLEKAKDLKCPEDSTVDPMLEVNCLG